MAAGIGAYRLGVTEATPRVIATGTVEETVTRAPIAGASVLAERYNTTTRERGSAVATTSASGAYVIYDELELGAGPYRFTATSNGYFGARSVQMGWNGSSPLSVPFTLSPLTGDAFEPDGLLAQANGIAPDGPAQNRTLHPAADQDWCMFSVAPGTTYTIAQVRYYGGDAAVSPAVRTAVAAAQEQRVSAGAS